MHSPRESWIDRLLAALREDWVSTVLAIFLAFVVSALAYAAASRHLAITVAALGMVSVVGLLGATLAPERLAKDFARLTVVWVMAIAAAWVRLTQDQAGQIARYEQHPVVVVDTSKAAIVRERDGLRDSVSSLRADNSNLRSQLVDRRSAHTRDIALSALLTEGSALEHVCDANSQNRPPPDDPSYRRRVTKFKDEARKYVGEYEGMTELVRFDDKIANSEWERGIPWEPCYHSETVLAELRNRTKSKAYGSSGD